MQALDWNRGGSKDDPLEKGLRPVVWSFPRGFARGETNHYLGNDKKEEYKSIVNCHELVGLIARLHSRQRPNQGSPGAPCGD